MPDVVGANDGLSVSSSDGSQDSFTSMSRTTEGEASSVGVESSSTTDADAAGLDSGDTTDGRDAVLLDDGVLARWFVDDAGAGQVARSVGDGVAAGLDLELVVVDDHPQFVEDSQGNRGLQWTGDSAAGRAEALLGDSALGQALMTTPQLTLEMVIELEQVNGDRADLFAIGSAPSVGIGLAAMNLDEIELLWDEQTVARLPVPGLGERHVLHMTIDTEAAGPQVRGYLDGEPQTLLDMVPLSGGSQLPVPGGSSVALGSRPGGISVFRGRVYYCAIYSIALDDAQVANNAIVLFDDDDRP